MADPRSRNAMLVIVAIVVLLAIGGAMLGRVPARSTPTRTAPAVVSWTPPNGYEKTSQDPTVAYQWGTGCSASYEACWVMDVTSRDGCSSLYIELSIMDAAGTAIGYTNEVLTGLTPGQQGRMTFQATDDGARRARISDVSCR